MFPDFPFDPQLPSFLPHQEVQKYLERYCQSHCITPHIRVGTVTHTHGPLSGVEKEGTHSSISGYNRKMFIPFNRTRV